MSFNDDMHNFDKRQQIFKNSEDITLMKGIFIFQTY